MRILYFGTVCDLEKYNTILENCRVKPSVATIVFESALLDGLKKNGIDIEVHCFPMIPTFPNCKLSHFGKSKEILPCGYECRWLNTINYPILKQISRRLDARKVLKRWCIKNKGKGIILTYSIPPFLVKDIIKFGKKYSIKTIAIVPDLLRDMYINENDKLISTKLKKQYIKPALKMQSEYDGYVYLTDAMHNVIAPNKPYTVMEGIADISNIANKSNEEKYFPRAIMYAGMIHEKYGVINLLDAFEKLGMTDTELWLFGDGTAVPEVKKRARINHQIKYFGTQKREMVIEYEKKATLLVNPRDPNEKFTKYSFPSKTIEYMLSGTPLLTTKLEGIPEEYFGYLFYTEDNSVYSLVNAMEKILISPNETLSEFGFRAKKYIIDEKNSYKQAARIIEFFREVQNDY